MNSRVMYDLIIMLLSYLNKINFTLTRLLQSLSSDLYTYFKNHAIIGSQRMTTGEFVITLLASFLNLLSYSPSQRGTTNCKDNSPHKWAKHENIFGIVLFSWLFQMYEISFFLTILNCILPLIC